MKTKTGMVNNKMMAWHYTRGHGYREIIKSGFLKCADAGITKNEKPVLWFSINQLWEPTVNGAELVDGGKTIKFLTMFETWESQGCFRFGIPSNHLIPWIELKKIANIPSKIKQGLEISALEIGSNPYQWYGCMQPMDITGMVIEVMKDFGKWQSTGDLGQQAYSESLLFDEAHYADQGAQTAYFECV